MVDRFVSYATGPAAFPGEPGAVIRPDKEGEIEMVNLIWGFAPPEPEGRPLTYLRSEGQHFGRNRCLIPGSQFSVSNGQGKKRRKWRVTLNGKGDLFYFAAVWRPAEGDWLPSYAMITIPANPDIEPCQERQVAVIRREDRMAWLDPLKFEQELLTPLPRGSFSLEQIEGPQETPSAFGW